MRIDRRRRDENDGDPLAKGPWSDLPPPAPKPRTPWLKPRGSAREPIIRNWRGLLIVLFLLLVAPFLARIASAMILGLFPGH